MFPKSYRKLANGGQIWRKVLGLLLPAMVLTAGLATAARADRSEDWPMFGQNLQNTASAGDGSPAWPAAARRRPAPRPPTMSTRSCRSTRIRAPSNGPGSS